MKKKRTRNSDPVALAKQAMAGVLSRAIDSKNDERVLAASKAVLAACSRTEADAPPTPDVDPLFMDYLTASEMNEVGDLLDRMDALKAISKTRRDQPPPFKHYDAFEKRYVDRAPTLEERKARYKAPELEPVAPPPPPKWSHVELDEDEYIEEDSVYRRDPATGNVEWVEDLEEGANESE